MNHHGPDAIQEERRRAITRYYRLHARIYDLTRWTFLLGRRPWSERSPCQALPPASWR